MELFALGVSYEEDWLVFCTHLHIDPQLQHDAARRTFEYHLPECKYVSRGGSTRLRSGARTGRQSSWRGVP